MAKPSERDLRRTVDNLRDGQDSPDTVDVRVTWQDAAPAERPDGMTWRPATDEEPATLQYDVWSAQRATLDALDGDTDIVAFLAGYGSGKTIFGARWLIKNALEHDGSRFLSLGIDFTKARSSTHRVLLEQLPGERTGIVTSSYNGPEQSPVVADYSRQHHRLTFINDSVIKLGSADRWNRYAGDSYGAVWLDEPSHYGEDLHDLLEMIGSRLRGRSGPKVQFWSLTGNGHGPAFDVLEREQDSNGDPLGLNIEVVRASTLDNPYLSDSDKQRFQRQYGNTSREQQALYGGFAAGSGTLLSRDQLQFTHVDDLEADRFRWHIGVDLSYVESKSRADATGSDYTAAALVGVSRAEGQAYLFDVARERGLTLHQGVEWLAKLAGEVPSPTVKVEDVGGQKFWIQEARREVPGKVVSVSPGRESKESRIQDMSILFERGDVVLVDQNRDENLGYDPRFQPFVREWLEFGNGTSPDILDATYYSLENVTLGERDRVAGASGDFYGR